MKEGLTCLGIVIKFALHTDAVEELLDHSLHCEEISVTVEAKCKLHPLIGILGKWQALRQINICHLIESGILISSVIVGSKRSKHTVK